MAPSMIAALGRSKLLDVLESDIAGLSAAVRDALRAPEALPSQDSAATGSPALDWPELQKRLDADKIEHPNVLSQQPVQLLDEPEPD